MKNKDKEMICPRCGMPQEGIKINEFRIIPKEEYMTGDVIEVRWLCVNSDCRTQLRCNLTFNNKSLMTASEYDGK